MAGQNTPPKGHKTDVRQLPLPFLQISLPNEDRMFKGRDLIEARILYEKGSPPLTGNDRLILNKLLRNAHSTRLGVPGEVFTIQLAELIGKRNDRSRIGGSIQRLMQTIVRIKTARGPWNTQLLGGNDFHDDKRTPGQLRYRIDPELAEHFARTMVFANLEMSVMEAFRSKYSLLLYEHLAVRLNLDRKFTEDVPIADLRDGFLGVAPGKLDRFSVLCRKALDPAIAEINAFAPFNVSYKPQMKGRSTVGVTLSWWEKETPELMQREARIKAALSG